jgi:hypothetical protein
MPDSIEGFSVLVHRHEDGYVTLQAECTDTSVYGADPWLYRMYRPGNELGEVIDDAARIMCGWAALGQWGFLDAGASLRQLP